MNIEEIQKSEDITELAKALLKFHKYGATVSKDGINPHFKKSYATLSSTIEATRGPLSENGLLVMQHPVGSNVVCTILMHESGQFIQSSITMPAIGNTTQSQGSAITYAKRYAMTAILNLPTEDDDGNGATDEQQKRGPVIPPKAPPKPKKKPLPEDVFDGAIDLIMIGKMEDARTLIRPFALTELQKKDFGTAAADRKAMDEQENGGK
jgi:hypothetical protein